MSLFNKAKEVIEKNIEAGKVKIEEHKKAQEEIEIKKKQQVEKQNELVRKVNKVEVITCDSDRDFEVLGLVKGYGFSSHDPRAVFSDIGHMDAKVVDSATKAERIAFYNVKKMAYDIGADSIVGIQVQNLSTNQIINVSTEMLNKSAAKVNSKLIRETFIYGTAVKYLELSDTKNNN